MIYSLEQIQNFSTQTFAFLQISEKDHVLTLTLNRPEKKNALNPTLMRELAYALAYAHYTPGVWAVELAANGDVFCAGADLKAFAGQAQEETVSTIPNVEGEILIGDLFAKLHKPCVARVHAAVYAGGFLLICGCTHVVALETATFSLPEVKRGLYPMQVMASLLQILPPRKVLDLCIRGKTMVAFEAYALGLVTDLAVDSQALAAQTQSLLTEICENSPTAIRMGLEAYDALRQKSQPAAHAYLKGMLNDLIKTEDAQEGLAAFMQKRKPIWTGK